MVYVSIEANIIILKCILNKWDIRMWSEFNRLRVHWPKHMNMNMAKKKFLSVSRIILQWLWFTDFVPCQVMRTDRKKLSEEAALFSDAPSPEIRQYKIVKNFRLGCIDIPRY